MPRRAGSWVVHADPEWAAFAGADWLDRIMDVPVTDRFHAKQGRSIGRWTLTAGGRQLVVYLKRHYELPRRHGWLASLVPGRVWSPGLEEYEHLAWARAAGLPVPRVLAAGEYRGPGGRLQSFLAVEELTGCLALHEAIPLAHRHLSAEAFAQWKRGLVGELARLSRELHRRRHFHQDLYLCHYYIPAADCERVPEQWAGRVTMIDFHRLARRRLGRQWWLAKDLGQLLFSTVGVAGVTARDAARFWKLYRAGDWGDVRPPAAWVGRLARWKAARYTQHNAKRGTA
ncbi:MAG: lipopolysaccharide kinase InaA family protein [Gemmataceae bacterium]